MTKTLYRAEYATYIYDTDTLDDWSACQCWSQYDVNADNFNNEFATIAEAKALCVEWSRSAEYVCYAVRVVRVRYNDKTGRVLSTKIVWEG